MRRKLKNLSAKKVLLLAFFCLLVIGYFGYLNYHVTMSFDERTLNAHIDFAENMMNGEKLKHGLESLPHVGYFYSLIFLHRLGLSFDAAAIFLLTVAHLLAFISVYIVFRIFVPQQREWLILTASAASLIVGTLYLPFLNPQMYFGHGSPNTHHNSTLILLRPFATAAFFILIYQLESGRYQRWWLVAGSVCLFLGVIFKPTFIIVFLPAFSLYLLFRPRRFQNLFLLGLVSLPAIIMLGIEYFSFYEMADNSRNISLRFLEVWQSLSPNIPLSIFQALAFPILFSLFFWKKIRYPDFFIIAWFMTLGGMAQYALLAETTAAGATIFSANWIGGYLMGMLFLYLTCMMEMLILAEEYKNLSRYEQILILVLVLVLLGHLISGFITDYSIWLYGSPHPFQ